MIRKWQKLFGEVDDDFKIEMMRSFDLLSETFGYRPPVLLNGEVVGSVVELESRGDGVWGLVETDEIALAVRPSYWPTFRGHLGNVLRAVDIEEDGKQ